MPLALAPDRDLASARASLSPSRQRIQSTSPSIAGTLRKVWAHRELIYFLAWRDIKLRYKQTWVGSAWAILQPFCTMVVFSVFFGYFARIPSGGVPYPIFAYAALLPWQLFSFIVTQSAASLVANQGLIRKVYFPRTVLPAATVLPALVDFANAFLVLLGMMLFYGTVPSTNLILLPLFLLLAIASALAVGIWLAAMNALYRDIHHAIPFFLQTWFFATPITYPTDLVPSPWRTWLGLNPMVGVVEGFRYALLGKPQIHWPLVLLSVLTVQFLLFGGLVYFRNVERTIADVV